MEKMYKAYEKTIDGKTFYFVKQFLAFPEFQDVPPVLSTYGMHTDFKKACNIALIQDVAIQTMLSDELGIQPATPLQPSRAAVYSFKWTATPLHSMLRLIRLR